RRFGCHLLATDCNNSFSQWHGVKQGLHYRSGFCAGSNLWLASVLLVAAEELRNLDGEQRMVGEEGAAPWKPTDRRAGTKPKAEFAPMVWGKDIAARCIL